MMSRRALPFVRRHSPSVAAVVVRSSCDANVVGKNKRDEEAKKKRRIGLTENAILVAERGLKPQGSWNT